VRCISPEWKVKFHFRPTNSQGKGFSRCGRPFVQEVLRSTYPAGHNETVQTKRGKSGKASRFPAEPGSNPVLISLLALLSVLVWEGTDGTHPKTAISASPRFCMNASRLKTHLRSAPRMLAGGGQLAPAHPSLKFPRNTSSIHLRLNHLLSDPTKELINACLATIN